MTSETAITPEWLTYKQAEMYSSISRTTLWELIGEKKIKAAKVGRAVRIQRASLEDFMQKNSAV